MPIEERTPERYTDRIKVFLDHVKESALCLTVFLNRRQSHENQW